VTVCVKFYLYETELFSLIVSYPFHCQTYSYQLQTTLCGN